MFHTNIVEKIKKNTFFPPPWISCRLWHNVEKYCPAGEATDDSITRCMRSACWITKAADTHSEYVMLIAFPLQQWLHEGSSMLCYTYIACLVYSRIHIAGRYKNRKRSPSYTEQELLVICYIIKNKEQILQLSQYTPWRHMAEQMHSSTHF